METSSLMQKVNKLPKRPGVYIYKNSSNKIIYVGKAKSLRDRVKSYFVLDINQSSKTSALVRQIVNLEFIEVENEFDALILESQLIKKHKPKYNIQLKDDKSAIYIIVRNEVVQFNSKKIKLPRVMTVRENELQPNDISFGPYIQSKVAQTVIRYLRKMYPYRDCSPAKFQRYNKLAQPCFYGHLGLCLAPCSASISTLEYKKDIKKIIRLLNGDSIGVVKSLENEMWNLSKSQEYEEAAKKRDIVRRIKYVTKQFRDPEEYIDNPYLIDDIIANSLDELVSNIPTLKKIPIRIECYDISNTSGKEATGSMVVATNGRLDKKEYKKFKINLKDSPDDFEMMREVLRRRFKHILGWPLPELLVVDGGKGQVSAATKVLAEMHISSVSLIGLAKKYETIVLPDFTEIVLEKNNSGLKLLQRLRDEAHRFAKTYHIKLRMQKLVKK